MGWIHKSDSRSLPGCENRPRLFATSAIVACVTKHRSEYDRLAEQTRELITQGATFEEAAALVGCSPSTLRRRGVHSTQRSPGTAAADVPPLSESLATATSRPTLIHDLLTPSSDEQQAQDRAAKVRGVNGSSQQQMDDLVRETANGILKAAAKGRGIPKGLVRAARKMLTHSDGLSLRQMDDLVQETANGILKEAAKGRSNVPKGLVRRAEDLLTASVGAPRAE